MVSDPKACNNIVTKDQAIFEATEPFLEYVYCLKLSLLLIGTAIVTIPCM